MRKVVMLLSVAGLAACFCSEVQAVKVKENRDPNQPKISGYLFRGYRKVSEERYLGTPAYQARMKKEAKARKRRWEARKFRAYMDKKDLGKRAPTPRK